MENFSRPLSPSLGGAAFKPSDRLLGKLGMVAPPVVSSSSSSSSSLSSSSSTSSSSTSSSAYEKRRKRKHKKRKRKKTDEKHKHDKKKHKKGRKRKKERKHKKEHKKRRKHSRAPSVHVDDEVAAAAEDSPGKEDASGDSANQHRLAWEARKRERDMQRAWRHAETERLEELAPKPERGSHQARMDRRFQHRNFAKEACAELNDSDIYGDGGFF